jgi:hypothetical protein
MHGSSGLPSVAFPGAEIKLAHPNGPIGISRAPPGRYDDPEYLGKTQ